MTVHNDSKGVGVNFIAQKLKLNFSQGRASTWSFALYENCPTVTIIPRDVTIPWNQLRAEVSSCLNTKYRLGLSDVNIKPFLLEPKHTRLNNRLLRLLVIPLWAWLKFLGLFFQISVHRTRNTLFVIHR